MDELLEESTLDPGAPLPEETAAASTGRMLALYEIGKLLLEHRDTARVIVRDNVSRRRTTADFPGSRSVTFKDNTRIRRR